MMQTMAHYININHPTILELNANHGFLGTCTGLSNKHGQNVLTVALLLPEGSVVN